MQMFLNEIIEGLKSGNIILVVTVAALALVFYAKSILDFLESKNQLRIEKIEKALKSDYVKGLTRKHLEDEIETEYYKLATGINLNRNTREAIINFINEEKEDIGFYHFKRALPHIKYFNNTLKVEITRWELLFYYFSNGFSVLLVILGLVLLVIPGVSDDTSISFKITFLSMGVYFIVIAMFVFHQTLPVYSAKIIKDKLERTHNNHVNSDG